VIGYPDHSPAGLLLADPRLRHFVAMMLVWQDH